MEHLLYISTGFLSVLVYFALPGKVLTFKKDKKRFTVFMLMLNLAETVFASFNPAFNDTPIRTLLYFAQFAFYVFIAYEESLLLKATAYVMFLLSISLSEIIAILFAIALGLDPGGTINNEVPIQIISFVFCAVLTYSINTFLSLIFNKIRKKHFTKNIWQFQIIVLSQFLMVVSVSYSIFLNSSLESIAIKNPGIALILALSLLISAIGDIFLYRILITNSKNYELKNELEIMQTKNKLELEYYEKLKKNIDETRKMNHDFNNILTVIQSMIKSSDSSENKEIALKTVEELKETIAKNKIRNYCENELVNLVVINKAGDIINEGIDFSANLNVPQNIKIKNSDLCRIFTNLLDNAKEACMMSRYKEKAFIVLSSQIRDDYLYITSENYFDYPINKKKDKFISAKENHKGLGMEIIKEIAKDYSGDFVCNYNDNVFTATVSLINT